MLTGDSLFVGDIARPDLAVEKEDGARDDLPLAARELLALGDDVEVWPGHLGGSLCGGPAIDLKVSSTIGYERRHNALLGVDDEDAFVARSTANLRPQPPNFQAIVAINRGPLQRRPIDIAAAHAAPGPAGRRAGDRRPHRAAVRRRAHPRRDLQHDPAVGLRHAAGLDRRPGPGGRARRPRRRRRAARRRARRGGRRRADRGLPRGRDDELARGAPAGRVDRADHRARAARARRRRCRSSTCASATSGRPATSPARPSRPTTTSTRSRRARPGASRSP